MDALVSESVHSLCLKAQNPLRSGFCAFSFGGNMELTEFFKQFPEVAVAFSGGVDSAYLLYAAKRYAKRVKAYYVKTAFQPQFELEDARRVAVLEDVMNPTNLGAIFRSAAALHMDAVLVTPTCCDPLYRRAARVSMGMVFQVPWTQIGQTPSDWPERGLELLRSLGFKTAAMALSDNSVSIDDESLMAEERLAIVLGTEGDGLSKSTIASCDYTVKIPMYHGVDSLNVAAAGAVAFWQLSKRK